MLKFYYCSLAEVFMKKILIFLCSLSLLALSACAEKQTTLTNEVIQPSNDVTASSKTTPLRIKLDAVPFLTGASSELSGVALNDDGRIYKYQTTQSGSTIKATTFLYQSKWNLLESHNTTALEAQTILKLASQGGFAKEYKTLHDRYDTLGLVD